MKRVRGRKRAPRRAAAASGFTLLEVLVASAVLALLLAGLLQMYALSLQTDRGAAARTELTYRAQQVVENLRMIQLFARAGDPAPAAAASVAAVPSGPAFSIGPTAGPVVLPNDPAAPGFAFWRRAGVVGGRGDPFRLSYTVAPLPGSAAAPPWTGRLLLVTVTAIPAGAPGPDGSSSGSTPPPAGGYLGGEASLIKRVDYVAHLVL